MLIGLLECLECVALGVSEGCDVQVLLLGTGFHTNPVTYVGCTLCRLGRDDGFHGANEMSRR